MRRETSTNTNGRVQPSPISTPESQKAAELIAEHFRKDIATGRLQEGDALPPEGILIQHFGVSRPTLRSAFRILESESLLTITRGAQGGPMACHPGSEVVARNFGLLLQLRGTRLADSFYAQSAIEPAAAALLAEHQPDEGLSMLSGIVAQQDPHADPAEFARLAAAFYRGVTEYCGNDILSLFGAVLHELFPKAVQYAVGAIPEDPEQIMEMFQPIATDQAELLRLIQRGEPDLAYRFWERHLQTLATITAERYPELPALPFTAVETST